jgi:hypothetical protein
LTDAPDDSSASIGADCWHPYGEDEHIASTRASAALKKEKILEFIYSPTRIKKVGFDEP